MNYIIDTHILIWLLFDHKKISKEKLEILKNPKNKIFITSISFWEISIKYALKKIELNGIYPEDLSKKCIQMGLRILDIDVNSMSSYYKLPKFDNHKDPFDRLIIKCAIDKNYILVSNDSKFKDYKDFGLKLL
ncbi:MAG: PilT protein domain protein [uncultured Campylobacterales bacterium]|uniref:PilT protein domain protein n=1 Tax=uncultured Campylobacterales bacterium TaxID=352960 RepID=A0A6S6SM25_9BACT|nr:MAG: PilT protein domain protein [uncultured Campylobacterales bacterium]